MAGSLLRAPFEERMAREDHARFERLSLQAASQTLEEVVRRVTPEDDGFTDNMLGKPGARELEPETAESLRKKAIEASLKSAHMVGYLRSMARFVIGKGPEFSPVDMPDETTEAMSNWWGKFKVINKWDEQLEDEITLRTWRDGETFIRRFEQIDEGPPQEWEPAAKQLAYLRGLGIGVDETELQPEDIPEGMVILRLIPADQITDPQNKISHGILTAAKDVCTVLAYLWAPDGTKVEEVIAAKEVMHVKIRVDQDVKRGRSLLEPILKRNKQYEDWLEYRVILNLVRAAVVLVKKVEGTAAQLSSVRSNLGISLDDAPEREEAANTRRQKMLKPGTTVHATPGISYEFLTPNLQAQDAQHDGRNILLSEAAATGLPEYMFQPRARARGGGEHTQAKDAEARHNGARHPGDQLRVPDPEPAGPRRSTRRPQHPALRGRGDGSARVHVHGRRIEFELRLDHDGRRAGHPGVRSLAGFFRAGLSRDLPLGHEGCGRGEPDRRAQCRGRRHHGRRDRLSAAARSRRVEAHAGEPDPARREGPLA